MKATSFTSFVLATLAFVSISLGQENYGVNWSGHRTYVLNTTATGANVTGNVANFPVLIRLGTADSAIFAAAKAGGADLRFTKANNTTRLQHEIEFWNAAGRAAAVWVKVDTVYGNSSGTLRMHWGNAGAADSSKGTAVFDTANGFEAVFHMNGALGDTLRDATANGYRGIPTVGSTGGSTAPKDTAGVIGSAKAFGGNNTDDDAGANMGGGYRLETSSGGRTHNSFNYVGNDAEFTLSVWTSFDAFRPTGNFSRRRGLISKASALTDGTPANADTALGFAPSNNDPLTQWYLRPNNVDRVLHVQRSTIPSGGTAPFSIVASGGLTNVLSNWNYASYAAAGVTTNGNRLRLYNATATTTREINDESGVNKDVDVFIGALAAGAGSKNNGMLFLNGLIDEVRISKVARDTNWVNLEYANQKAAQTLVTVQPPPAPLSNLRYVPANTAANDTVIFNIGVAKTVTPTFTGGPADSIRIIGTATLPAGVTFNPSSGVLSGTATAAFTAASRTIRAYGSSVANDTTSRVVVISAVVGPTMNLTYTRDTSVYAQGIPATANAPSWSGRNPTAFSVAPSLPAGLSINTATGVIAGTPTATATAANFTVTATNATDTATKTLRISVVGLGSENYANTTWPNKQQLYLNTQSNGANVAATVRNFPVLIRLDSAMFNTGFTQAAAGGADLRFTKLNNTTRLPHQVERWDAAGKRAEVWVLVDTVYGSAVTSIRMHWGNASAPNVSSGPQVFDTANGFQAVFHLTEPTGATALDATSNGFQALPLAFGTAGAVPADTIGAIGRGKRFNGNTGTTAAGSYYRILGSAAGRLNFAENGPYTLSGWSYVDTLQLQNQYRIIMSKSDFQYNLLKNNSTSGQWEFNPFVLTPSQGWTRNLGSGPVSQRTWQYIVGSRYGNANDSLYVDAAPPTTAATITTSTSARVDTFEVWIGRRSDPGTSTTTGNNRMWLGSLDEIRLQSVARSSGWVKLEFENQKASQTLVTTTQPPVVGLAGAATRVEAFGLMMKPHGRGLLFSLQGHDGQAGRATLALLDMSGRAVWSGVFDKGLLAWDGASLGGGTTAHGIYFVRVELRDDAGKLHRVLNRKIPYAP